MMKCQLLMLNATLAIAVGMIPGVRALAEDVIIRPQPQAGPLDNPLKGWCPYVDAGEIHQPYSMVFQYVSWRELEPVENEFRLEEWENSWNVPEAQGKHIIFRVHVDYPSKPSGLPDWLRNAGVKETAYKQYGGGRSPDYNDPRMIEAMERLIAKLGERFNPHPRVAFIQLGLLGFWGEWHTHPQPALSASPATERRVIDAFRKAFPDKLLMARYAKGYAGQQDWLGFHDDMFPEDTDNGEEWSFLAGLRKTQRTDNWKVSVVGGEMVPGKAKHWLGTRVDTTLTMLDRSHFTWVGPYCPALEKPGKDTFLQRSEEVVRKLGYEFQITEVTHPVAIKSQQPARLSLQGRNQGVAPFSYPWAVEWALLDDTGAVVALHKTEWDLRKWHPGSFTEQTDLHWDVAPGTYRLGLGIRDPWQNRPAVRFANDLPVSDGWTVVSKIQIQ